MIGKAIACLVIRSFRNHMWRCLDQCSMYVDQRAIPLLLRTWTDKKLVLESENAEDRDLGV